MGSTPIYTEIQDFSYFILNSCFVLKIYMLSREATYNLYHTFLIFILENSIIIFEYVGDLCVISLIKEEKT